MSPRQLFKQTCSTTYGMAVWLAAPATKKNQASFVNAIHFFNIRFDVAYY